MNQDSPSLSQAAVLQCGCCLRQHDGNGQLRPFKLCEPVLEDCRRGDCASLGAAILQEQKEKTEAAKRRIWKPIFDRRAARREEKSCPKPARGSTKHPARECRTPYRDDDRVFVNPEQSAAFAAAPEAAKEAFLDYDSLTSRLDDFLRVKHFREWFKNTDLLAMLEAATARRVNNFNNVMSKLRARYDDEQLALDVDTQALSATIWRVRVCLKSESFRLRGENPSRR